MNPESSGAALRAAKAAALIVALGVLAYIVYDSQKSSNPPDTPTPTVVKPDPGKTAAKPVKTPSPKAANQPKRPTTAPGGLGKKPRFMPSTKAGVVPRLDKLKPKKPIFLPSTKAGPFLPARTPTLAPAKPRGTVPTGKSKNMPRGTQDKGSSGQK